MEKKYGMYHVREITKNLSQKRGLVIEIGNNGIP